MGRFIDFIRHANAVLPEGITDDRKRVLSPIGTRQARAFGEARRIAREHYRHVILSGIDRTVDTAQHIMNVLGLGCQLHIVPAMFDPEKLDQDTAARQLLYKKLGSAPLAHYHDLAIGVMISLGLAAADKLQPIFRQHPNGNILIVGHGVYTNEVILDTFMRDLTSDMKDRLLNDPALAECAGYRLMFDDGGNLRDLLRLPAIILDGV